MKKKSCYICEHTSMCKHKKELIENIDSAISNFILSIHNPLSLFKTLAPMKVRFSVQTAEGALDFLAANCEEYK